MKTVLLTVATVALAGTLVPALLYLGGMLSKDSMQWVMLAATVVWFAVVPWIKSARRAAPTPAQQD